MGKDLSYRYGKDNESLGEFKYIDGINRHLCVYMEDIYTWDELIRTMHLVATHADADALMVYSAVFGRLTYENDKTAAIIEISYS
jgi:hypothetical protein